MIATKELVIVYGKVAKDAESIKPKAFFYLNKDTTSQISLTN